MDQDFIADIEERERAGTPGVLQTLKAALALELKSRIGVERIEAREQELIGRALARWCAHERIELLGNPDPRRRIGIVSFNLRDPRGRYLHPKFVTVLLNDLFGIQSRAGCSCAGPYGHRLLGIDQPTSELYRDWVRKGFQGIKPGWCRVGFHYAMDDLEAAFVMDAVEFIAEQGYRFLPLYRFDSRHRHVEPSRVSRDACRIFARCRPRGGRLRRNCVTGGDALAELCRVPGRGALLGRAARRAVRDGRGAGPGAVRGAEVLQRRVGK